MFLTDRIEVRQTEKSGRGVFARAEIEPGTLIGDFLGIVTPSDEGSPYEHDAVYDMWWSDTADIHPNPEEDGVHLINCSCEPNCAMAALGRHTIIFALRRIYPGEELSYDYFLGDQDEECDPGTDNCHCGSAFCRGTMYSNPAAYEAWEKHLEEIMEDLPENPPVPYGEKLPPLDKYPQHIADDPIYPLFGTHVKEPLECAPNMIGSMSEIRKQMRESGKQLSIPTLKIVIEGILYGGHLAIRHQ